MSKEDKWKEEAAAQGLEFVRKINGRNAEYVHPCGHFNVHQVSDVRIGNFKCSTCQDQKIRSEAEAQGLEFVRKINGRNAEYVHPCGHTNVHYVQHVRKGEFKCTTCQDQKIRSESEAQGLVFVRKVDKARAEYVHPCRYTNVHDVGTVRKGKFKCTTCQDQKFRSEAEAQGLVFVRKVDKAKAEYVHLCGHTNIHHVSNVRIGNFKCSTCVTGTSRGEIAVHSVLTKHSVSFEQEHSFKIGNQRHRFDFVIDGDIVVEVDGRQHFESVNFFGSDPIEEFQNRSHRDLLKNLYCLHHGIPLYRIHYEVVEANLVEEAVEEILTRPSHQPGATMVRGIDDILFQSVEDFLFDQAHADLSRRFMWRGRALQTWNTSSF